MVEPFLSAAAWALEIVRRTEVAAAWAEPSALAGYTVGGLAGHLLGATGRLEWALDQEAPAGDMLDVASFYGLNRIENDDIDAGSHPFIRDDGAKRGEAGAAAVAAELEAVVARRRTRLPGESRARAVPVLNVKGGATALDTYLRTRVVELVVHGDDLAASVAIEPVAPPADAAEVAIGVFVELARARSGDLAVVRAFTRAERVDPETLRVL